MRKIPLVALVLVGLAGTVVFGWYALQDWAALKGATDVFYDLSSAPGTPMERLFVAESVQNIHRTNLFAEGVWTLLSAIILAIGIHGLCVTRRPV